MGQALLTLEDAMSRGQMKAHSYGCVLLGKVVILRKLKQWLACGFTLLLLLSKFCRTCFFYVC